MAWNDCLRNVGAFSNIAHILSISYRKSGNWMAGELVDRFHPAIHIRRTHCLLFSDRLHQTLFRERISDSRDANRLERTHFSTAVCFQDVIV